LTNIVERLNKIVIDNTKGERFITLFLAKYNERTRLLNFINAGHNATAIYSNGELATLKLGTTMIGVFDELPFINQGEVDIDPGTLIVNYTDGLLDHEYHTNKSWGEETLMDFIKAYGHLSPDHFNQLLMDHIKLVIKGKPIDDVTLLTLRIF